MEVIRFKPCVIIRSKKKKKKTDVADTLSDSRGGSHWNPVGFGFILSFQMILDVRRPSPPRRHAQLVDILAQRRRCVSSAVVGQLPLWRCLTGTGTTSFASSPTCSFSKPACFIFFFYEWLLSREKKKKSPFETLAAQIWHCPRRILFVFFLVSFLYAHPVISLICAPRCLCSRSLACVTSFPLPVQPMLIIAPVFQTPLLSQGVYLRTSKSISLSAKVTQLMAFPMTVIPGRKERRDRTSADSRVPKVYLAGYWDDLTMVIFRTVTVVSGCLWVWDTRAAETNWNLLTVKLICCRRGQSDYPAGFQRAS